MVDKPEIIVNNKDPGAFEFRVAEIDKLSVEPDGVRLTLIFRGVCDMVFRGFYGVTSSEFQGQEFAAAATQIAEMTNNECMLSDCWKLLISREHMVSSV